MLTHLKIKIFGLVQGVNFRQHTKQKAEELEINGFVCNETDGSVYIEAEGEHESLNKFTEWCKTGPSSASVTSIEIEKGEYKNFEGFIIKK